VSLFTEMPRRCVISETQLCFGGQPYFHTVLRALTMILSRSSCSPDGGEDLSSAGTFTSSKNFSIPAGMITPRYLAGRAPEFL
jgi:hypothetical protein